VHLPGEPEPLILVAIDDITERKLAEQELRLSESRYRRIFETAREGIWLLDGATGEILDLNQYLVDLLGYTRDELLGKKPWKIALLEDPETFRTRFAELRRSGLALEPELAMRSKSGERILVEAISHVYELGSRPVVQSNLRDVSERERMQDQLRQVQKLDSIGNLAGGIAHDFNNILNIISAHWTRLSKDKTSAQDASLDAIQKAVDRGTAVVKQLLTFARKSEAAFEPTDVNAVVEEVTSMLRETFPRNIELETRLDLELPDIRADGNQLHQALLNLAVNARDAMPQGGRLTISTELVSKASVQERRLEPIAERYVCVEVSDTGQGMDAETRRHVFEPFFTTKKTSGGRGLGLAVVYGIVNGHRALVDVESEPEKGTTFRLYFAAPDAALPEASERRTPAKRRKDPSGEVVQIPSLEGGGVHTLLLVEDEELLLNPVKSMLEDEGFEVLTARDGIEAVAMHAANHQRISAVILDLGLPRMAGWEAFLRMREKDPLLRCLIASGNIDADKRREIRQEGADTIRKPYSVKELIRAVRRVLNGGEGRQESE
jgi:PAS domain S-box-containing protein